MAVDLTTTNVLLGILATVSVLEVLAVGGLFAGGFILFRRLTKVIESIDEHRIAPAAAKVDQILDDAKYITGVARRAAEHADRMTGWWRVFRGA